MGMRMNLVLEAVKEDRTEIRYVNTKGMKADGLSKLLGGASFWEFRGKVLIYRNKSTGGHRMERFF